MCCVYVCLDYDKLNFVLYCIDIEPFVKYHLPGILMHGRGLSGCLYRERLQAAWYTYYTHHLCLISPVQYVCVQQ